MLQRIIIIQLCKRKGIYDYFLLQTCIHSEDKISLFSLTFPKDFTFDLSELIRIFFLRFVEKKCVTVFNLIQMLKLISFDVFLCLYSEFFSWSLIEYKNGHYNLAIITTNRVLQ